MSSPVEELHQIHSTPTLPVEDSFEEVDEIIYVEQENDEMAMPCNKVKSNLAPVVEKLMLYKSCSKSRKNEFCSEHIKPRQTKFQA